MHEVDHGLEELQQPRSLAHTSTDDHAVVLIFFELADELGLGVVELVEVDEEEVFGEAELRELLAPLLDARRDGGRVEAGDGVRIEADHENVGHPFEATAMITRMPLPQPADLTSLVLRTDFSSDAAWEVLQAVLGDEATCVSDPAFADADIAVLIKADTEADESSRVCELFVADAVAMVDHQVLAVDLFEEPGRTFRVAPEWFAEVSANFSIANMDFADYADYADSVDESGTFRGWE